mmetsp:Transcript_106845/g.130300  ORF Transcript_106845/g.130300 Transcript_106845/m.130300 type:complete len:85 (-) Transcript_106845:342-596(-)
MAPQIFPQQSMLGRLRGTSGPVGTLRSLSVPSGWPEPSEEDGGGGSIADGGSGKEDPDKAKATGEIGLELVLGGVKALCSPFPF